MVPISTAACSGGEELTEERQTADRGSGAGRRVEAGVDSMGVEGRNDKYSGPVPPLAEVKVYTGRGGAGGSSVSLSGHARLTAILWRLCQAAIWCLTLVRGSHENGPIGFSVMKARPHVFAQPVD